jgi:glutathione synthase/RimK-type ligase-like ATP-grasp enzyme
MLRIALATAVAAFTLDEDMDPLLAACAQAGVAAQRVAWDDPTVSWQRFDAVLLRSTWDYSDRLPEFLAWCERVSALTQLINPLEMVRWNTDKRYLGELARAGVPVIETHYLSLADAPDDFPAFDEFVIKPTVGAGSRGARRFVADERDEAAAHAAGLLAQGREVMVQPYLAQVDSAGETALLYFAGAFSHAVRKGPLLPRGSAATRALFAPEQIGPRQPSEAELGVAERVLDALPFARPVYARVDLLPSADGPRLLELELTEPSLFFDTAPGAAQRFVAALCDAISANILYRTATTG